MHKQSTLGERGSHLHEIPFHSPWTETSGPTTSEYRRCELRKVQATNLGRRDAARSASKMGKGATVLGWTLMWFLRVGCALKFVQSRRNTATLKIGHR